MKYYLPILEWRKIDSQVLKVCTTHEEASQLATEWLDEYCTEHSVEKEEVEHYMTADLIEGWFIDDGPSIYIQVLEQESE